MHSAAALEKFPAFKIKAMLRLSGQKFKERQSNEQLVEILLNLPTQKRNEIFRVWDNDGNIRVDSLKPVEFDAIHTRDQLLAFRMYNLEEILCLFKARSPGRLINSYLVDVIEDFSDAQKAIIFQIWDEFGNIKLENFTSIRSINADGNIVSNIDTKQEEAYVRPIRGGNIRGMHTIPGILLLDDRDNNKDEDYTPEEEKVKVVAPPLKKKGKPFSGAGHSLSSTPVSKKKSRSKKVEVPAIDRRAEMLAAAESRFQTQAAAKLATPAPIKIAPKVDISNWTPKDMN